ncbi:MAG: tRNA (N(6)-L-threonylcarbamoyladenosine(37)-C(2))-methylthiotransferase MtaB [Candidatus Omnitrophota bacterium]|jgi:threonylcarbamoyladenosine tRNA methylthiotransferase MtaB
MAEHSSSKKNVRFYTLGCKVNQYETQAMREALERKGYRDIEGQTGAPCDLVVVNTCTVTQDSDRTSRYWIRRLRREHPGAQLAVTGCYAEKNRIELEAMPEVDFIFLNDEKPFLAKKLLNPADVGSTARLGKATTFMPLSVSRFEGKTRAYVKVQDGCNHACSFCKVSIVRGPSRSRALPEILDEVIRLRDGGYREIILTGIQLGAYGLDLESRSDAEERHYLLRDVIEASARVDGVERIRLSSIELTDLGKPIREAFRDISKLCPHVHLPLQSGDNEVLMRMNRRYTREEYRDVVLEMKEQIPDFEFSMDIMAGFPGETEAQFANTLKLLETLEPLKTHVFPYSRREGTQAADWGTLSVQVVRDRVHRLMELAERISRKVRSRYLGRSLEILAEYENVRSGVSEGFTRNYLKVFFEYPQGIQGCIIPFKLTELFQGGFRGSPGLPR